MQGNYANDACFPHKSPNIHVVFERIDADFLYTCLMTPFRPLNEGFVFFFRRKFGLRPELKKNKRPNKYLVGNTHTRSVNGSTGAHRTRVHFFRISSLKNGVSILGFCAENICNLRINSCLVIAYHGSFSGGSIFCDKYDMILALRKIRSSNICAKLFASVPWGSWNRLVEK